MRGVQMNILNFESDVECLTKAELGELLKLNEKEINRSKKTILVEKFLTIHNDDLSKRKMYKKFSERFALHPTKVQELLHITPTERKRWTSDGKLKVSYYDAFNKWGKNIGFPMYDAYALSQITLKTIELWRNEHVIKVRENRSKAMTKSIKTRTKNKEIQRKFYDIEWHNMLKKWYQVNAELAATLQLAYWTVWLSRWAKEFQLKAYRARTKQDEYISNKENFYQFKNDAIQLLFRSPYAKLSFYSPPSPHKIINLHFCPIHYDNWVNLRQYDYYGKWEYFEDYKKEISKCQQCSYDQIDHYYSLYYLSIKNEKLEDYHFSFHTPYPIGKSIFPSKDKLEHIHHEEQEGIFRFGRTLFDEEKVIFTVKEIIKRYEDARRKFLLYFPDGGSEY